MTEKYIPQAVIDEAVAAIINTREFCGNERRAAYEVAAEHGLKEVHHQDKVWRIACFQANAQWEESKKQAGVT